MLPHALAIIIGVLAIISIIGHIPVMLHAGLMDALHQTTMVNAAILILFNRTALRRLVGIMLVAHIVILIV